MVYKNWELSKRAWLARGGKSGIKMLRAIFPVFLSVGIKQAYNAARALAVRSQEEFKNLLLTERFFVHFSIPVLSFNIYDEIT